MYPEFSSLITKYDLFLVTETKLDSTDLVCIDGYTFKSKPRLQKYIRKSGGTGIFIKNKLNKYIQVLETESDYVFWIQLDKNYTKLDQHIIFGIVYVPPTQSRFLNEDEFELFQNEITSMCSKFEYVYISGDINAQTGDLADYTQADDFLCRHFDFDDQTKQFYDQKSALETLGIQIHRKSSDKKKNNNGFKLVELCKNNNLTILNGRFGKDQDVGKPTFRGISVIDYIISSLNGLTLLSDFEVIETDRLFSDGHALLSFEINTKGSNVYTKTTQTNFTQRPKWDENKAHTFKQNIDMEALRKITEQLTQGISENNLNQSFIDSIVNQISNLFSKSAGTSFETKSNTKRYRNGTRKNKPWFGPACHNTRKAYHLAKKKYHRHSSIVNRINLENKSKTYKNTMNKYINIHNQNNEQKLRTMHTKRPKDYWKFLNSLKSKEQVEKPDIQTFYDFFKNINMHYDELEDIGLPNDLRDGNNDYLNAPISAPEIEKCIRKLKNSKSPGTDNVLNEYIRNTKEILLPIYVTLFNYIMDTGLIPTSWVEGVIVPIYKNKGDSLDPNNYRPITLLSCMGKLFTAVLNSRLTSYLEENDLLDENQAGFRKNYSTVDHIFTLQSIIELLRFHKKKLFCTFIDFSKAFDSVWRIGLWRKLLEVRIDGKFFNVIYNLYLNIKSCVSSNNEKSPFFSSFCGLRQGENLSPVLFSLFLNDLEAYLFQKQSKGIVIDVDSEDFTLFLKLIILLYADDTVILAEDAHSMQKSLDDFYTYCNEWKLKINTDKSKVIVFGTRKNNQFAFSIGPNRLDIVDSYKYLGVFFSRSGSFLTARKHIATQARKALHLLYTRINNLHLPIDLQLKLFDNTVLPILTYGSEVWGYENIEILERIHAEFLRKITKTRKSTPYYMLYAELGRTPIDIAIKARMIGFWYRIVTGKQTKLTYMLYNAIKNTPNLNSKWLNFIQKIFTDIGRADIWLGQRNLNFHNPNKMIKRILIDQNLQKWHSSLQVSSKGTNYQLFKDNIQLEQYFILLQPKHYLPIVKFRTGNHHFPVEVLRWEGIPLLERKCLLCNGSDVGDEFHYLLCCKYFDTQRKIYIQNYYIQRPNMVRYKELMSMTCQIKLRKLSIFISIILKHFQRRA